MLLKGEKVLVETRYVVALFVCVSCCLLETGYWAGCAFGLTQYGLAPGQGSCGRLCEQEPAGLCQSRDTSFPNRWRDPVPGKVVGGWA